MFHAETVNISAQIETTLRDDLLEIARRNDRSFSAELRRALRLHVLREALGEAHEDDEHSVKV